MQLNNAVRSLDSEVFLLELHIHGTLLPLVEAVQHETVRDTSLPNALVAHENNLPLEVWSLIFKLALTFDHF